MFYDIWRLVSDRLKGSEEWRVFEPVFFAISIYVLLGIALREYLQKTYGISLGLQAFLTSYLWRQVSLGYGAIAISGVVIAIRGKMLREPDQPSPSVIASWSEDLYKEQREKRSKRITHRAFLVIFLAFAAAGIVSVRLLPQPVGTIRVVFLDEPEIFDRYALGYLIYELNRQQTAWYFEVDYRVFNRHALTQAEAARMTASSSPQLVLAGMLAPGPVIGITSEQLGSNFFWKVHHRTGVISTFGWDKLSPPSAYEYLVHCLITQSLLLHLDAAGSSYALEKFHISDSAFGSLFAFAPRRKAARAEVLAPNLTAEETELLLNRFGPSYLGTTSRLLTLEWLHSPRIEANLKKVYQVEL